MARVSVKGYNIDMEKHCRNCKHWKEENLIDAIHQAENDLNGICHSKDFAKMRSPETIKILDDSGINSMLALRFQVDFITGQNFWCIHFASQD